VTDTKYIVSCRFCVLTDTKHIISWTFKSSDTRHPVGR